MFWALSSGPELDAYLLEVNCIRDRNCIPVRRNDGQVRGSSIIGPRVKISVVRIVVKGSIIINLVPKRFSKGAAGHIFNNLIQRKNGKVLLFHMGKILWL